MEGLKVSGRIHPSVHFRFWLKDEAERDMRDRFSSCAALYLSPELPSYPSLGLASNLIWQ